MENRKPMRFTGSRHLAAPGRYVIMAATSLGSPYSISHEEAPLPSLSVDKSYGVSKPQCKY